MNTPICHDKPKAGGVAVEQLKSVIARVESLEEQKAGIAADIRDVFAEAKGRGFCPKTIRKILKIRKQDTSQREETIHDTYLVALDMAQPDMFDDSDASAA